MVLKGLMNWCVIPKPGYMTKRAIVFSEHARSMSGSCMLCYLGVTDAVVPCDSKNMPLALHSEGLQALGVNGKQSPCLYPSDVFG